MLGEFPPVCLNIMKITKCNLFLSPTFHKLLTLCIHLYIVYNNNNNNNNKDIYI